MATAAQLNANRANAQNSTGPRTVEGKTASSMNALKHGADAASIVIPGEDPALYEHIAADYHRDLRPAGAVEEFQVDTIIQADWQRRRLKRIEANLYRALLAEGSAPDEIDVTVLRDSATGKLLRKVWSQIASIERAHSRALAELRRLRREAEQTAVEEIEAALDMPPEYEATVAAKLEQLRQRNEPNSTPTAAPAVPSENLALRL
jgi:hypothetical protein